MAEGRARVSPRHKNAGEPALRELRRAMDRPDAPLPPPDALVRIPYAGFTRIGAVAGTFLGMYGAPALLLTLSLEGLSRDARGWLFCAAMILGAALGLGAGMALGARFGRGKALLFDARGIWEERDGRSSEPLPWSGLRRREGRIPQLVAEDGRTLAFRGDALPGSPEVRYLVALVLGLPALPARPRVPMWTLGALAILGFGLVLWGISRGNPPVGDEPYWSPERLRTLAALLVGMALLVGGAIGGLVRQAENAKPSPPDPARGGEEIAALFREHRFRPPAIDPAPGETYVYRDPEFWRTMEREAKRAGWGLAAFGTVLASLGFGIAVHDRGRTGSGPAGIVLGIFCLATFVGIALLLRPAPRAGFRLRVEGESATASTDAFPERTFPWPPARSHEATEAVDWTDELRDGKFRLRIDRRLLVPEERATP